jgi:hypothetical protein
MPVDAKTKYQLTAARQAKTRHITLSAFKSPPAKGLAKQPIKKGIAVKPSVIKIQTINPIVSNIVYSPIHYTLTLND